MEKFINYDKEKCMKICIRMPLVKYFKILTPGANAPPLCPPLNTLLIGRRVV